MFCYIFVFLINANDHEWNQMDACFVPLIQCQVIVIVIVLSIDVVFHLLLTHIMLALCPHSTVQCN